MTCKINADTSDGLKIVSDTSGEVDIQDNGTTRVTVGDNIDIHGNELILDADGDTSITADTDDQIDFKTGGTDRLQLDSGGRVYINGKTSVSTSQTSWRWDISGINYQSRTTSGTIQQFRRAGAAVGSISVAASSKAFNTSSDYRLKENVNYTWDATTRLKQLKPARFNFIADDTNTLVDGFIAHEVSSIVPEAITGTQDAVDEDGNPDYQGIDQSKLVPLLVKTIQELEARITALESE